MFYKWNHLDIYFHLRNQIFRYFNQHKNCRWFISIYQISINFAICNVLLVPQNLKIQQNKLIASELIPAITNMYGSNMIISFFLRVFIVNQRYCWWKKSCTSWYGSLSHYLQGFSTIPGGCLGYLPSTVVPDFYQLSTPGKTHRQRGNHQLLMISTKRTTVRRRSTWGIICMAGMDGCSSWNCWCIYGLNIIVWYDMYIIVWYVWMDGCWAQPGCQEHCFHPTCFFHSDS